MGGRRTDWLKERHAVHSAVDCLGGEGRQGGTKEENQTGGGLPANTTTNLNAAQQQAMYFQH